MAVVAEIFVGWPDQGFVSAEPLIFHLLIKMWKLLIGIL